MSAAAPHPVAGQVGAAQAGAAQAGAAMSGLLAARQDDEDRHALIAALAVAAYTTDAAGHLTAYNAAAAAFWGWRPPLGGQRWCGAWRLRQPDGTVLAHDDAPVALCLRHAPPPTGWAWAERPDGAWTPFIAFPSPLRDAEGTLTGAVCVLIDITDLHAAETARAASEAQLRAAQELSPDGMLVLRALPMSGFAVTYANPAAARLLGLPPAVLAGAQLADLLADRPDILNALLGDPPTEDARPGERELLLLVGGTPRRLLCRAAALADGLAVTIADVTDQRLAEARIREWALRDPVTGLPNRHAFQERLSAAIALAEAGGALGAPQGLATLCVDLDGFDVVNDSLGHAAGDALLRIVGDRLRDCAGPDALVARLGSDDFAVLLTNPGAVADAEALAARITADIARPLELGRYRASIACSIGIALSGEGEATIEPDALLRRADLALRRARAEGGGRARIFAPSMAAEIRHRLDLQADLRDALATEALELHYQPIFDLRRNALTGFEALMRWRHPERGLVSPGEFIPLAEETGLIVPMGEWALRRACHDAAGWGHGLKVAVNLSPVQLLGAEVADSVAAALRESGLDPTCLELEITESVVLRQHDQMAAKLQGLRGMGVRLALDDFGTGYCSLAYLRSFRVDKIKIDQSFVRDAITRPECRAIVRSVAGLATELGIGSTAEGVEGPAHLVMARRAGCAEAQGYHLGRPAPLAALGPVLAARYGMPGGKTCSPSAPSRKGVTDRTAAMASVP